MKQVHIDRFWAKVDPQCGYASNSDECWEWQAWRRGDKLAYGGMRVGKQVYLAHRLSWEIHNGPIPDDTLVCHTCDNPACVNPAHLFLGTTLDNVRDKMAKGRYYGRHKLIEEDVRRIREARLYGAKIKDMAHIYNVSQPCISAVISRKNWAHVE